MNMVKRVSGGELNWIERIRRRVALPQGGSIALGIGDDCAIYRAPGSVEDLLFTTDLLVEEVHFRRETHSAADVGWKALARGLSDLAAMGGDPRFCLLSLALPPWADSKWVDRFYGGLLRLSARAGAPLIGGDLGTADKLVCDIVACGSTPVGRALRRDSAHAGDLIYVSGSLGGSALGLAGGGSAARRRHLRPEPRLELGKYLRNELGVSAAMDISDGISLDLRRMCKASGLSAEIEPPPLFPGATLEQALHGGEDYELLFTAPPECRVPAKAAGLKLTRIGAMRKGKPGSVRLNGSPLPPLGYDHLR
jgi:thiamine-monophosphate kinase